jgi:hypothetical protein
MQLEQGGGMTRLVLTAEEVRLFRFALERASFIDTPSKEQAAIAAFCARALDLLKAETK